jgi:hypothetical protein
VRARQAKLLARPKALSQKSGDRTTKIWRKNLANECGPMVKRTVGAAFSIHIESMWIAGHAAPEYPSHAK